MTFAKVVQRMTEQSRWAVERCSHGIGVLHMPWSLTSAAAAPPSSADYASLARKKTKIELIMLSLVVFGIEICYAAETAFVSPILQKIGVPIQYMSMVWGLSPMLGFLACPILGSLSDDCTSRLGRRRPFIIIYSIGNLSTQS